MMERYLTCLFLCGLILTLAAAPIPSYEDDIAEIIHFNNTLLGKNFLFKVLEVKDEDDSYVSETSTRTKVYIFSIKETTCLSSGTDDVENCVLKPDGVVMKCVADIINDQQHKSIRGRCIKDTDTQEGEHAMKEDVMDETQENFEFSVNFWKFHFKSCLSCVPDYISELEIVQ